MKKQSMNGRIKKAIAAITLAATVMLAAPSNVKASDKVTKDSAAAGVSQAHVQYVGVAEEGLWFNVKYANPRGEKFTLLVKNGESDVLFQGSFTDVNFSKKIKILNDKSEAIAPTFIIKTAENKRIVQSFEVNTASHTVEEVIVTRS